MRSAFVEGLNGLWDLLTTRGIPSTVLLILLLLVLRWLATRYVRRERRLSKELKLRWQNVIKNAFVLAGLIGLILIWAPQLRAFAFSLTALAVAIVIATKELILCVSGSLLRASSSTFAVGDLVEFGGHTGYVVDQSLLSTQLQELDEVSGLASGNQVVLPNSLFLTHAVKNYSHLRPYNVHSFTLHIDAVNAGAVERLLAAAEESATAASRGATGEREFEQLPKWKRQLLQTSAPKVQLSSTSGGKIAFVISIICQESRSRQYQAEITRAFFRVLAAGTVLESAET
jgi:small-conductance mechanosensitive channel